MSLNYGNPQRPEARRPTNSANGSSTAPDAGARTGAGGPNDIRINGFEQVLAMLDAADPAFRESLLRRLAQRDPALVRQLRQKLGT